jgi:hypothetical protein
MTSETISRIKQMIAQNTQMNTDLSEVLTLAEEGWKKDTDLIEAEIQEGKDAVAQQVATLTTRAETAEALMEEKESEITELKKPVEEPPVELPPTETPIETPVGGVVGYK